MGKRNKTMNLAGQVARNQPRRRVNQSVRGSVGSDRTTLGYRSIGATITTDTDGLAAYGRHYIPGYTGGALVSSAGVAVANYYSDGKFNPGSRIKWVPEQGFTTTGRVYVGFTTNAEIMAGWDGMTQAARNNFVRSLGNAISFPIYQETEIQVPTELRRRLFDINANVALNSVDVLDRCCQTLLVCVIIGAPAIKTAGAFEFYDNVYLEGLNAYAT